ncbi:pyridoxine 5'-phosphate synthase [Alteromonadaceae bacterium Bs31]|nr:pyridoxine 5'-phosphate synthase [Alteromonadaceae bacterium Bs31]
MSIALSVNLNKIALIRNSREGNFPNVKQFGELCLNAGADGLTVHPRPDQRHIRPEDTLALVTLIRNFPSEKKLEFNIEGNPMAEARGNYPGLIPLALDANPDQCTLVPDSDSQLTSDHGFDLKLSALSLEPLIKQLKDQGIRVSLFMDPDKEQIRLARETGADRIELYTGPFAAAFDTGSPQAIFEQHRQAAEYACSIGLEVNAGHDLNLRNMALYKTLPGLKEVSIGHALTVDALLMGMENAVQAYLQFCK